MGARPKVNIRNIVVQLRSHAGELRLRGVRHLALIVPEPAADKTSPDTDKAAANTSTFQIVFDHDGRRRATLATMLAISHYISQVLGEELIAYPRRIGGTLVLAHAGKAHEIF